MSRPFFWNRALVVAGPISEVEVLEVAASAGFKPIRLSADSIRPVPQYWRERPKFSLRSLLRFVEPTRRRRLRRELPREKSALVRSRLETLDGRLRLEYWFNAPGTISSIERLCRQIVTTQSSLSFVVVDLKSRLADGGACLVTAAGTIRYRLPSRRRTAHMRSAIRKWGHDQVGKRLALKEAADAMLQEVSRRWDVELAGERQAETPGGPVYEYVQRLFGPNPTNRRLLVAGPAPEVEWLIARARGRLRAPTRPGSPWRSRPDLSFRALAELLPGNIRPAVIPPEIERSWFDDIWAYRNVLRARWILTDYEWDDDVALEQLLVALSKRYREVCFTACWEQPDTFEAGGTFVWRGRIANHSVSRAEYSRIMRHVYARYDMTPDVGGDETTEATADHDVDMALLDQAESHWDGRILRIFERHTPADKRRRLDLTRVI